MRNFRHYEVWKRAILFCGNIYKLTASLPNNEQYGIGNQLKRASVSISSNIAEGCSRKSEKDFARFIEIGIGSAFEVESLLYVCKELEFIDQSRLEEIVEELQIIQKQLNVLNSKLRNSK